MGNILIVEDDIAIRWNVKELLSKNYTVYEAGGVEEAVSCIRAEKIDLCILDINLSDGDGLSLCREIRTTYTMPILFMTVYDDEDSIVRGLESGADDYIVKPFSLRELESRIRAQMRRLCFLQGGLSQTKQNEYRLDSEQYCLMKGQATMRLTKKEFEITQILISRKGCLVTRNQLLWNIWDSLENYVEDNTLSVYVSRLRKKITNQMGECPIETIPGVGYRWKED
jgi:DNA-binding response OmpR family regulator